MTSSRCPGCGAAVLPDATWCTLCFHALGASDQSVPLEQRAPTGSAPGSARPPTWAAPTAGRAPESAGSPRDVLIIPQSGPLAERALPTDEPVLTPAEPALAEVGENADPRPVGQPRTRPPRAKTWPCPRCDTPVGMAIDACSTCGASFLTGAESTVSVRLPVVGDVGEMSKSGRIVLGVVVGVVVTGILVAIAALLGLLV